MEEYYKYLEENNSYNNNIFFQSNEFIHNTRIQEEMIKEEDDLHNYPANNN